MIVYFALGFAVLLAVAFIIFQTLNKAHLSLILKTVASFGFITLGVLAVNTSTEFTMGLLMLLGGVCGLIGDVFLAIREWKNENESKVILSGICAFSVGQALYYAVMVVLYGFSIWPLVAGVVITGLVFLSGHFMKMNYKGLVVPAYIYAFILATTMSQGFYAMLTTNFSIAGILLFAGFVMFLLSDLVLSFIYFLPQKNNKLYIPNYAAYYAAQILIMFAISFI